MADQTGDSEDAKKPTTGSSVPPIEPTPATPKNPTPGVPAVPIPPLVDLTGEGRAQPPRPDPYAQHAPPANPYVQGSVPPVANGYYAPQQNPYAPLSSGPRKGLALTSMILGIVGIFCCCFGLISIGAIITGHIAQRTQPWARGFWLTGLITGYVGLVCGIIYFIYMIWSGFASSAYRSNF